MSIEITMPRLSDTMEEGTLIKWHVKEGDKVNSGDVLADVETDKATMELQSYDDGIVAQLALSEGETVPVGQRMLLLAEEGESIEDVVKTAGGGTVAPQPELSKKQTPPAPAPTVSRKSLVEDASSGSTTDIAASGGAVTTTAAPNQTAAPSLADTKPASVSDDRVRISPLARRIAEEHGVDLAGLRGSGPDGRIIKRDILAAIETQPNEARPNEMAPSAGFDKPVSASVPQPQPFEQATAQTTIPLTNMRKTIARRLVESKTTIPHFTVSLIVDMDPLAQLRAPLNSQLKDQGVKLSVNDFIVRACAVSLLEHPVINSSWSDAGIVQHGVVNVGVAIALPEDKGGGLVVATIRDTTGKGLRQIGEETRALAQKARTQGLSLEEMSDGTFTISNLGMFGVEHFEAIINPPQAAILAVGAAIEKPVVRGGQIVVGHEMTITLSADHRVVDGAAAAQFLQTLRGHLENPASMLV